MTSGKKLRELLKTHGSFTQVELHLAKYHNKAEKDGRYGKWVTRQYLIEHEHYTKQLDEGLNLLGRLLM